MISKKWLALGIVVCLTMPLAGCGSSGSADKAVKTINNVTEKVKGENPYLAYKDDYKDQLLSPNFAYYYTNELIGDMFNKERAKIQEIENNQDSKPSYVTYRDGHYQRTKNQSDYQYKGDFKDNKPEGWGILYMGQRDILSGKVIMNPIYRGEFKDGIENGYGQLMMLGGMGKPSSIGYEGAIKNGKKDGIGISYNTFERHGLSSIPELEEKIQKAQNTLAANKGNDDIASIQLEGYQEELNKLLEIQKTLSFYVGEHKNDKQIGKGEVYKNSKLSIDGEFDDEEQLTGDVKLYYPNGNLFYEGEAKDNKVDGKGKLYYESGKLKYEGEFKKGQYDGKGTEYTEDGKVEYEGNWKNGDYDN